jgi:hypothetical protein
MPRAHWLLLFALVLTVRLSHCRVLWIEEAYPLTAAIQMLHGRLPYADFWFDKPPLSAAFYLLFGALPGIPLRIAGALYVTFCAYLASRLGGAYAAWLLAIYLSFGIPSAVMAIAPDLLLVAPHLAAVWLAQSGRPIAAGMVCGVALLIHTKALLILAIALLFAPNWRTLAAFAATLPLHAALGANYWTQVWWWGRVYADNTFVKQPALEFIRRTSNWIGFHSAAVIGMLLPAGKASWRDIAWVLLSCAALWPGLRFFPRYYFFLLVPCVVLAGRNLPSLPRLYRMFVLALLLIPIVRFGPRDVRLALGDDSWSDLALFRDSQSIAQHLNAHARPTDTLFTWGYRPDVDALSRLKGGTPYLESQPITCIFADRHLTTFKPLSGVGCEERARQLGEYAPAWIVDGLGPTNPLLALARFYPLGNYELVLRTPTATLYRLVRRDGRQDARYEPTSTFFMLSSGTRSISNRNGSMPAFSGN